MRDNIESIVAETQGKFTAIELNFILDAANIISICRKTLSYSYMVNYFEDFSLKDNEMALFKYQQKNLENNCESTHNYFENNIWSLMNNQFEPYTSYESFKKTLASKIRLLQKEY